MRLNSTREVQQKPCKTCPFAGEKPIQLTRARYLEVVANLFGNGQHLCHSTNNENICRGGRDLQLRWLCAMGYLSEPTDQAFNEAVEKAMKQSQTEGL